MITVRGVLDSCLDSKMTLKISTQDSLTDPSTGNGSQVAVKAC